MTVTTPAPTGQAPSSTGPLPEEVDMPKFNAPFKLRPGEPVPVSPPMSEVDTRALPPQVKADQPPQRIEAGRPSVRLPHPAVNAPSQRVPLAAVFNPPESPQRPPFDVQAWAREEVSQILAKVMLADPAQPVPDPDGALEWARAELDKILAASNLISFPVESPKRRPSPRPRKPKVQKVTVTPESEAS